MAYKLLLKTNSAIEIEDAIAYYSLISIDLAKKLEAEIRIGFKTITQNPEILQFRYNNKVRIYWLDKFPYGIYYLFDNEEVIVIAFWHDKEDIPTKIEKIL